MSSDLICLFLLCCVFGVCVFVRVSVSMCAHKVIVFRLSASTVTSDSIKGMWHATSKIHSAQDAGATIVEVRRVSACSSIGFTFCCRHCN